jgi:hypothetical protein
MIYGFINCYQSYPGLSGVSSISREQICIDHPNTVLFLNDPGSH